MSEQIRCGFGPKLISRLSLRRTSPPTSLLPVFLGGGFLWLFVLFFRFNRDWTWAGVVMMSLAPDSLWWGILTAFVCSPQASAQMACLQMGGWYYPAAFFPLSSWRSRVGKLAFFKEQLHHPSSPLQTATFVLKVGGVSTRSRQKCLYSLFVVFITLYTSACLLRPQRVFIFPSLCGHSCRKCVYSSVLGQMWWGQHLWVHSCTWVGVES